MIFCTSVPIIKEYGTILARFVFRGEKVGRLLEDLKAGTNCIVAEELPEGKWVEDDPEDDKFIACALAVKADAIVSSDIHIKKAAPGAGVKVTGSGNALKLIPDKK